MRRAITYLVLSAIMIPGLVSCARKESPVPPAEGLFAIEYLIEGQDYYEFTQEGGGNDYPAYSNPEFGYYKGSTDDMCACFSFDSSVFSFNLKSDRAYFINNHVYQFNGEDTIVLNGTPLAKGSFIFRKDSVHPMSDWHSLYYSFNILFDGTTVDGLQVSSGRLRLMQKIANETGASIYTFFVYGYNN